MYVTLIVYMSKPHNVLRGWGGLIFTGELGMLFRSSLHPKQQTIANNQ